MLEVLLQVGMHASLIVNARETSTKMCKSWRISSGSRGWVRGARNMKSMRPLSAAIFFMTYFHRAGRGGTAPGPPGSATARIHSREFTLWKGWGGGYAILYFDNYSKKPHEVKNILVLRGTRGYHDYRT